MEDLKYDPDLISILPFGNYDVSIVWLILIYNVTRQPVHPLIVSRSQVSTTSTLCGSDTVTDYNSPATYPAVEAAAFVHAVFVDEMMMDFTAVQEEFLADAAFEEPLFLD